MGESLSVADEQMGSADRIVLISTALVTWIVGCVKKREGTQMKVQVVQMFVADAFFTAGGNVAISVVDDRACSRTCDGRHKRSTAIPIFLHRI